MQNPSSLASWNPTTSPDPCGGQWCEVLRSSILVATRFTVFPFILPFIGRYGVTCDQPGGSVTELDLGVLQLTGALPEAMSALGSLRTLYLNVNTMTGPLPVSWSALINLKVLFLRDNELTGKFLE